MNIGFGGLETAAPWFRKRYELRLQFCSRNLNRHVMAGVGGILQLRPSFLSLLKMAMATSSSVSTDVSTRICATLA